MEFGFVVVVRKGKTSPSYELDQGDHTIGSSKDSNIILKFTNKLLLDTHAVIQVNENGVATIVNKSTGAPVRVNGKAAFKPVILRHGDTFEILDKEFQYFNEKLKDVPEDDEIFAQENKKILGGSRKSVLALSKTPAKSPSIRKRSSLTKTLIQKRLNQSCGMTLNKSFNKTLTSPSTRRSIMAGIHKSYTPGLKIVPRRSTPFKRSILLHATPAKRDQLLAKEEIMSDIKENPSSPTQSSRMERKSREVREEVAYIVSDIEAGSSLKSPATGESNRSARASSRFSKSDKFEEHEESSSAKDEKDIPSEKPDRSTRQSSSADASNPPHVSLEQKANTSRHSRYGIKSTSTTTREHSTADSDDDNVHETSGNVSKTCVKNRSCSSKTTYKRDGNTSTGRTVTDTTVSEDSTADDEENVLQTPGNVSKKTSIMETSREYTSNDSFKQDAADSGSENVHETSGNMSKTSVKDRSRRSKTTYKRDGNTSRRRAATDTTVSEDSTADDEENVLRTPGNVSKTSIETSREYTSNDSFKQDAKRSRYSGKSIAPTPSEDSTADELENVHQANILQSSSSAYQSLNHPNDSLKRAGNTSRRSRFSRSAGATCIEANTTDEEEIIQQTSRKSRMSNKSLILTDTANKSSRVSMKNINLTDTEKSSRLSGSSQTNVSVTSQKDLDTLSSPVRSYSRSTAIIGSADSSISENDVDIIENVPSKNVSRSTMTADNALDLDTFNISVSSKSRRSSRSSKHFSKSGDWLAVDDALDHSSPPRTSKRTSQITPNSGEAHTSTKVISSFNKSLAEASITKGSPILKNRNSIKRVSFLTQSGAETDQSIKSSGNNSSLSEDESIYIDEQLFKTPEKSVRLSRRSKKSTGLESKRVDESDTENEVMLNISDSRSGAVSRLGHSSIKSRTSSTASSMLDTSDSGFEPRRQLDKSLHVSLSQDAINVDCESSSSLISLRLSSSLSASGSVSKSLSSSLSEDEIPATQDVDGYDSVFLSESDISSRRISPRKSHSFNSVFATSLMRTSTVSQGKEASSTNGDDVERKINAAEGNASFSDKAANTSTKRLSKRISAVSTNCAISSTDSDIEEVTSKSSRLSRRSFKDGQSTELKESLQNTSRRSLKRQEQSYREEMAGNSTDSTVDAHQNSIKGLNVSIGTRNRSAKRISTTFDESTQDNNLNDRKNISNLSSQASTVQHSDDIALDVHQTTAKGSNISMGSRNRSSKRISTTFDESTQDNLNDCKNISNLSSPASTVQNSRDTTLDAHQDSAKGSGVSMGTRNRSSKRISTTFDESTQDNNLNDHKNVSNLSSQASTVQNSKDTILDAHQGSVRGSDVSMGTRNRSSKRISTTFDESTQDNLNDCKNISNLSSQASTVQNLRDTTLDAHQDSARGSGVSMGTRNRSSKRISTTFGESTQDNNLNDHKNVSDLSSQASTVQNSKDTILDAHQGSVRGSDVSMGTRNKSAKRISTTFDESAQDKTFNDYKNVSCLSSHTSAVHNSRDTTLDAHQVSSKGSDISIGTRNRSVKRISSTFDESTQDNKTLKNKSLIIVEDSTKEALPNMTANKSTKSVNILDDTEEILSPVKPLSPRRSIRNYQDKKSFKSQMSASSSLTITSVDQSTGLVRSVSSQSFSSFKKVQPDVENEQDNTEVIDVVNITSSSANTPDARRSVRLGSGITKTPNMEERHSKPSSTAAQMFDDVSCTSTPFHRHVGSRRSQDLNDTDNMKTIARTSVLSSKSPSKSRNQSEVFVISSTNASWEYPNEERSILEASGVPKRRSSTRSVSRSRGHSCVSCQYSSVKRSRSRSASVTDSSVSNKAYESPAAVSRSTYEATSPVKKMSQGFVRKTVTPLLQRQSVSCVSENTPDKSANIEDETPKSHVKPTRRSSKTNQSAYNPVLEDITPVTPEKLQVSGFTEEAFKTPVNTPGLFESIRESIIRSKKRHRESNGSTMKENKRARVDFTEGKSQTPTQEVAVSVQEIPKQKSPLNRLSNFEGVKKLMKTPPKSPKNDLRNIPNLRRIMSPKQQNSPKNDLTAPLGVKRLLRTPKKQKGPINDLTNVSGVANIFNVSGVEVLHHGSDIENSEDLFTKITGKRPLKAYSKGKSLSPNKSNVQERESVSRKTMGDLPVCSPRVQQWVEDHVNYNLEEKDQTSLAGEDLFAKMSEKPERKSRSGRSVSPKKVLGGNANRRNTQGDALKRTPKVDEWKTQQSVENIFEIQEDAFDNMLEKHERKSRNGRSMSLNKSSQEGSLQMKSQSDTLKATPDIESWKNNERVNDSFSATPLKVVLENVSERPERKSRVGLSISPKRTSHPRINRRKTQGDFLGGTLDIEECRAQQSGEENLLKNVSEQSRRNSRIGRSVSPKNGVQMEAQRRKIHGDSLGDTPDVGQEKSQQDHRQIPEIIVTDADESVSELASEQRRSKTRVSLRKSQKYEGTTEDVFVNMSVKPERKSRSGRSVSPKKSTPGDVSRRKTQGDFLKATPNVETWKSEQALQVKTRKSSVLQVSTPTQTPVKAELVTPQGNASLNKTATPASVRAGKAAKDLTPSQQLLQTVSPTAKTSTPASVRSKKVANDLTPAQLILEAAGTKIELLSPLLVEHAEQAGGSDVHLDTPLHSTVTAEALAVTISESHANKDLTSKTMKRTVGFKAIIDEVPEGTSKSPEKVENKLLEVPKKQDAKRWRLRSLDDLDVFTDVVGSARKEPPKKRTRTQRGKANAEDFDKKLLEFVEKKPTVKKGKRLILEDESPKGKRTIRGRRVNDVLSTSASSEVLEEAGIQEAAAKPRSRRGRKDSETGAVSVEREVKKSTRGRVKKETEPELPSDVGAISRARRYRAENKANNDEHEISSVSATPEVVETATRSRVRRGNASESDSIDADIEFKKPSRGKAKSKQNKHELLEHESVSVTPEVSETATKSRPRRGRKAAGDDETSARDRKDSESDAASVESEIKKPARRRQKKEAKHELSIEAGTNSRARKDRKALEDEAFSIKPVRGKAQNKADYDEHEIPSVIATPEVVETTAKSRSGRGRKDSETDASSIERDVKKRARGRPKKEIEHEKPSEADANFRTRRNKVLEDEAIPVKPVKGRAKNKAIGDDHEIPSVSATPEVVETAAKSRPRRGKDVDDGETFAGRPKNSEADASSIEREVKKPVKGRPKKETKHETLSEAKKDPVKGRAKNKANTDEHEIPSVNATPEVVETGAKSRPRRGKDLDYDQTSDRVRKDSETDATSVEREVKKPPRGRAKEEADHEMLNEAGANSRTKDRKVLDVKRVKGRPKNKANNDEDKIPSLPATPDGVETAAKTKPRRDHKDADEEEISTEVELKPVRGKAKNKLSNEQMPAEVGKRPTRSRPKKGVYIEHVEDDTDDDVEFNRPKRGKVQKTDTVAKEDSESKAKPSQRSRRNAVVEDDHSASPVRKGKATKQAKTEPPEEAAPTRATTRGKARKEDKKQTAKPRIKAIETVIEMDIDSPRTARAKRGVNKKYSTDEYEMAESGARSKRKVHFQDDTNTTIETPEAPAKRTRRTRK